MSKQRAVYPMLARLGHHQAKRAVPNLVYTHPGYFRVLVAEILLHAGLGIDFLLTTRNLTGPWAVVPHVLGFLPYLAIIHLVIAVMIVVGLYTNFSITRWGLRLSVTIFWAMAGMLFAAAFLNPISLSWGFVYAFVSLVSYAGVVEPTHYEDLAAKDDPDDPAIVRWQAVRSHNGGQPQDLGEIVDFECIYVNAPAKELFRITVPMEGGRMVRDFPHLSNVGMFDQFVECITSDASVQFIYPSATERGVVYPVIGVPINDGVICTFYREVVGV